MRNFGDEICIAMASSRDTPTGHLSGRLTVWKKIQITSPFAIIVFATEVSLRLALSHERFASALDHVTCVFATHHQCTYPSSLVRTSISKLPATYITNPSTHNTKPIAHHSPQSCVASFQPPLARFQPSLPPPSAPPLALPPSPTPPPPFAAPTTKRSSTITLLHAT